MIGVKQIDVTLNFNYIVGFHRGPLNMNIEGRLIYKGTSESVRWLPFSVILFLSGKLDSFLLLQILKFFLSGGGDFFFVLRATNPPTTPEIGPNSRIYPLLISEYALQGFSILKLARARGYGFCCFDLLKAVDYTSNKMRD